MSEPPQAKKKMLPILGNGGHDAASADLSRANGAPGANGALAPTGSPIAAGTAAPAAKRRLPVLANVEVAQPGDEDRPPWHWSAIGAVAIFVTWLPLAFLANGPLGRLLHGGDLAAAPGGVRAAVVILNVVGFALACFAGGSLVGRFGGNAGVREATIGGFAVAAIAWGLAAVQSARSGLLVWALLLAVVAAIGAGASRAGGRVGLRYRVR